MKTHKLAHPLYSLLPTTSFVVPREVLTGVINFMASNDLVVQQERYLLPLDLNRGVRTPRFKAEPEDC